MAPAAPPGPPPGCSHHVPLRGPDGRSSRRTRASGTRTRTDAPCRGPGSQPRLLLGAGPGGRLALLPSSALRPRRAPSGSPSPPAAAPWVGAHRCTPPTEVSAPGAAEHADRSSRPPTRAPDPDSPAAPPRRALKRSWRRGRACALGPPRPRRPRGREPFTFGLERPRAVGCRVERARETTALELTQQQQ